FGMLELTHLSWIYGPESGVNLFHIRLLAPDGERQAFDEYLPDRLVTFLGQSVQQAVQSQCSGSAAHMRRLVFYPSVVIKQLSGQSVLAGNIGSKKAVARLDTSGM